MYSNIKEQKNIALVLEVLKENNKIRRGDIYKEVMKKQKKKYGKSSTYQVISRDIDRLKKRNIIKIISGGPRSQILTLKD